MSLGYFDDLDDARDYFTTERLETWAWDELFSSAGTAEIKAIKNAFNRLYYDPKWSLPTYALATPAQLIKLKKANGEMAYYLIVHLADEDSRKGLQAQGVTDAGIVKEKYSSTDLMTLPVPPFVATLLKEWEVPGVCGGLVYITRDEDA